MSKPERELATLVASSYAALVGCGVAVAAVVHFVAAGPMRSWLDFRFPAVDRSPARILEILGSNVRLAALGVAAAIVVGWRVDEQSRNAPAVKLTRACCDLVIASAVAYNAFIIGGALGAYGWRLVAVLLPHAPVELLGFSLPLGLYRRARARRIGGGEVAWVGSVALMTLSLAAVLETFLGGR
ncbi:MAG TPA: hypothetical protein VKV27_16510 [Solirubrobacteraceae bacterium]|nr:hypothetical protein [Solirubrobacteraceae bacterium]